MRIDVALLPDLVTDTDSVFAVVDVLRASSAIVTLLERGVQVLHIQPDGTTVEGERIPQQLSLF